MSADIYQFPLRGRFAPARQRDTKGSFASEQAIMSRAAITACGSAWYHDEAIKEDRPTKQ